MDYKEVSKIETCVISKTTDITENVLAEINQETEELRTTVLENEAAIDCLLLKHNLGCAVLISLISLLLLTTKLMIYIKKQTKSLKQI